MTIKTIKKDAIVKVEFGTGFIQKIQELLMYIASQHTLDEMNDFKDRVTAKQPLENWMDHLLTVSTLLHDIEIKADEQGFTVDTEAPDEEPIIVEES